VEIEKFMACSNYWAAFWEHGHALLQVLYGQVFGKQNTCPARPLITERKRFPLSLSLVRFPAAAATAVAGTALLPGQNRCAHITHGSMK
jgi:hypothetical protein